MFINLNEASTLVIHLDEDSLYAGFESDFEPRHTYPMPTGATPYASKEQQISNTLLSLEQILHDLIYKQLKVAPENLNVFFILGKAHDYLSKVMLADLFFTTFNVTCGIVFPEALAALYSTGRPSGLVFKRSLTKLSATPIYNGITLNDAAYNCNFKQALTSQNLKKYVKPTLSRIYQKFNQAIQKEFATAATPKTQMQAAMDFGNQIALNVIQRTIQQCPIEVQAELYQNIVLIDNASDKCAPIHSTFIEHMHSHHSVHVQKLEPSKYGSWIGGSTIATSSFLEEHWLDIFEYHERGLAALSNKWNF